MSRLRDQVEEEHIPISLAHTIPNPWAMMVKGCNAMVALLTVLAAERLKTSVMDDLTYSMWHTVQYLDSTKRTMLSLSPSRFAVL